jgi:hypothetical protein
MNGRELKQITIDGRILNFTNRKLVLRTPKGVLEIPPSPPFAPLVRSGVFGELIKVVYEPLDDNILFLKEPAPVWNVADAGNVFAIVIPHELSKLALQAPQPDFYVLTPGDTSFGDLRGSCNRHILELLREPAPKSTNESEN